jgi:hypothetical protein
MEGKMAASEVVFDLVSRYSGQDLCIREVNQCAYFLD